MSALPALGQICQQSFLPGQPVQQLALGAGAQQVLRFMLAMDVHQLLAQLTQPNNGAGVAIDLRARAAVLLDDAFNVNPRTFIAIGHDIVVAALVWTFTFSLRWNFELDRSTQIILFQTLSAVLAVQVGCFVYFGLYRGI